MNKYAQLMNESEYVTFMDEPKRPFTNTFAFLIPQRGITEKIIEKFKPDIIMTVCETEPVHEDYRIIFETGKTVLVPSQFCKDVFQRQFPSITKNMHVFPHWPGEVRHIPQPSQKVYTFYTIGNAKDYRKNIHMLLEAFAQFQAKARLVIKATCNEPVNVKLPGVLVINGLVSDDHIEKIHASCDCYVNCSRAEGVGMGAVEAAIRNKPVIITSFGGLKEYVKTPFVVECEEECVGMHDFLYQPHMKWGSPSLEQLIKHMRHCLENNIRTWDHSHTREFTSRSVLCAKFSELSSLALTGSSVDIPSLTDSNRDGGCRLGGSGDDWVLI